MLFAVRLGLEALYLPVTPLAALVTHLFAVELPSADPRTMYVPLLHLPQDLSTGVTYDPIGRTAAWTVNPPDAVMCSRRPAARLRDPVTEHSGVGQRSPMTPDDPPLRLRPEPADARSTTGLMGRNGEQPRHCSR